MKFIGIDGCKAGWFYVGFDQKNDWQIGVFERIADFLNTLLAADLALIDIPIGIKSEGTDERVCDVEARLRLKPKRSSSVFPVPCRSSLNALNYQQASEINFEKTGRKLSKQTWNIMPKIKQIDDFLVSEKSRVNIREMHPELCFWALNQRQAMVHNKKTLQGFLERKTLLNKFCQNTDDIFKQARSCFSKNHLADDDILDALVGAVTARCYENLASLPQNPQYDDMNLPMEVVFAEINEQQAIIETPAGFLQLYARGNELVQAQWVVGEASPKPAKGKFLKNVVQQIQQYWQNPGTKFFVNRIQQGTEFTNKVWQALEQIPSGQTRTYGELAQALGTSSRAVGNACRKNPYPLIVPCHRVVSAKGLGGYDGATAGEKLTIKQKLLAHEHPLR